MTFNDNRCKLRVMLRQKLRFLSLFAGVGGFDLAFLRAGYECAGAVEFDPHAQAVYTHQFAGTPLHGDVTTFKSMQFGPVDVIVGGFPCQDLSNAGKRAGLDGARSGLFFEFIRIIQEMRHATNNEYPKLAVFENVPGLLTSKNGADFQVVLESLEECGAKDIGWRILDSQYAGVPQRRRRVFIVADFAAERTGEILALCDGLPGSAEPGQTTRKDRPTTAAHGTSAADRATLDEVKPGGTALMRVLAHGAYVQSGESSALRARDAKGGSVDYVVEAVEDTLVSKSSLIGRVTRYIIRRLTPLECERLQSFPDNWTEVPHKGKMMADTHRYRFMGNAVTVVLVQQIAERARMVLERREDPFVGLLEAS